MTRYLEPLGRTLAAIGVTPTVMTTVGLSVVIAGSVMVSAGFFRSGAAIILLGSVLDGLDGSVARASNKVTARGAFLDSAFDRVGEIAAFAGLGVASAGEPRVLLLIVLAIGGAMLVPYMRARAQIEGFDGRGGLMGRAERVLLFSLGLMVNQVEAMLWLFVILVWMTAFSRFVSTYRSLA